MRRFNLGLLNEHMQRGRPSLLFLHLGGSPRSDRSADAMLEVHRLLHSAVLVAAVDAERDATLVNQLLPPGSELPLAILVPGKQADGTTAPPAHFPSPLNSTRLVEAAVAALPGSVGSVCTAAQFGRLLQAAGGVRARGIPARAVVLLSASSRASPQSSEMALAMRVACARRLSALLCAKVVHSRCALPPEVHACPGVILLDAKRNGRIAACITDAHQVPRRLEWHADVSRHGRALGTVRTTVTASTELPGARAAVAIAHDLRGSPPGEAVAFVMGHVLTRVAPLVPVGAVALLLTVVRSVALGRGLVPWAPRRAHGGRRLGATRKRRTPAHQR